MPGLHGPVQGNRIGRIHLVVGRALQQQHRRFGTAQVRYRFGAALLCNNGDYNPDKVADAVLAAFDNSVPRVSEGAPPSSLDGRYGSPNLKAVYSIALTDTGGTVTVTDRNGKPGAPQPLEATGPGQYKGRDYTLSFDDNAMGFTLTIPRVVLHFTRLP